ncbi:FCD domain-containing protein [Ramlibacter tataouinensis]|uniref:FadR/GntR family transcriptional regulator n=1 Tax=Ramlibacter tataouinensis TaxID=94132 RepID=UPI0022F3F5B9|nr:FCD domain-containing protein [Ramlibacter tataouinensis]WBY00335.1 FCD domain-containing protein [Ramlibacter tataouinensis]
MKAGSLREFILDNLRAGRWRAGDRLPPERSLSDQFTLSRGSVRKVLQDLRGLGLIEQTVGSGTYVTEGADAVIRTLPAVRPAAVQTSPAELMEARITLEPAVLELVVAQATAADFERMDECCERAEAAQTLEEFEHWDGLLHEVIAGATRNSFVTGVFRLMNQARAQTEWGALKRRSVTPERRQEYQREHRRLVQALKARDLEQARSAALAHLEHVRRNLFGS